MGVWLWNRTSNLMSYTKFLPAHFGSRKHICNQFQEFRQAVYPKNRKFTDFCRFFYTFFYTFPQRWLNRSGQTIYRFEATIYVGTIITVYIFWIRPFKKRAARNKKIPYWRENDGKLMGNFFGCELCREKFWYIICIAIKNDILLKKNAQIQKYKNSMGHIKWEKAKKWKF